MLYCRLLIFFFKNKFFGKFFHKYHKSVKQFWYRSDRTFCQAWSGSKLFAKVTIRLKTEMDWTIDNSDTFGFPFGLNRLKDWLVFTEIVMILYTSIQFRLTCTPRTILHGCQIVHWDTLDEKRRCPKKLVWALWKCMVSMATHGGFENRGMPTKVLIPQPLLILDY